MTTKIKSTKKKLAITFVIVIFILIFVIWAAFFTTKYLHSTALDQNLVNSTINNLISGKVNIEQFKKFTNQESFSTWKSERGIKQKQLLPEWWNRPNINYIELDENFNTISLNIRWNITNELILGIINDDEFYEWKTKDNFYVQKILNPDNSTIIFLNSMRYSTDDFLSDMILFFFVNAFFSIIIYIIGTIFIHKTFIPVEQNLDDMKNFVHNAGHELKTPISVIDSNLQLFQEMKVYDEQMAIEMKSEVKKLNSLIDSLVKLSDIDNLKSKDSILLKDILEEIISDFWPKIEEKNINININIDWEKIIKAHKDYLYIFLANIIWNAIKYNKKWWKIDINLKMNSLSIQDTWIGINGKNINKIFEDRKSVV